MNCPVCHEPSRVLYKEGAERRRECPKGHRFTSVEVLKADHDRNVELLQDARDLAQRLTA